MVSHAGPAGANSTGKKASRVHATPFTDARSGDVKVFGVHSANRISKTTRKSTYVCKHAISLSRRLFRDDQLWQTTTTERVESASASKEVTVETTTETEIEAGSDECTTVQTDLRKENANERHALSRTALAPHDGKISVSLRRGNEGFANANIDIGMRSARSSLHEIRVEGGVHVGRTQPAGTWSGAGANLCGLGALSSRLETAVRRGMVGDVQLPMPALMLMSLMHVHCAVAHGIISIRARLCAVVKDARLGVLVDYASSYALLRFDEQQVPEASNQNALWTGLCVESRRVSAPFVRAIVNAAVRLGCTAGEMPDIADCDVSVLVR